MNNYFSKNNVLFFLAMFGCLISCRPVLFTDLSRTSPVSYSKDEIVVIGPKEAAPSGAIELGTVRIEDSGFTTDCALENIIQIAKMEVLKAGGNVLKITKHSPPQIMGSNCHRIRGKILLIEDGSLLEKTRNYKSAVPDSIWNYAKLYVYRSMLSRGPRIIDLYLNDTFLCRLKKNTKYVLRIKQSGINKLSARLDAKSEVTLDAEFGKEYYLKCNTESGVSVLQPSLEFVNYKQARAEFNIIKGRQIY